MTITKIKINAKQSNQLLLFLKKNQNLKKEIKIIKIKNNNCESELIKIKNSKFYRLWKIINKKI